MENVGDGDLEKLHEYAKQSPNLTTYQTAIKQDYYKDLKENPTSFV